jgi:hypothetical protein
MPSLVILFHKTYVIIIFLYLLIELLVYLDFLDFVKCICYGRVVLAFTCLIQSIIT